jgi:hypothetical protein
LTLSPHLNSDTNVGTHLKPSAVRSEGNGKNGVQEIYREARNEIDDELVINYKQSIKYIKS